MTQVGEGRGATAGGPAAGEILAERYQLEQHVNTDSAGRQIWYGVDILLRRPVAVVIRYPGGPAAAQMLQNAVEASRITHPNLVGVYDAIDEHARAYVVREWVDGSSLRDHVQAGPFDPDRATAVAHAVAAAMTAVHASGMTHGNLHPGTVLIGRDGRVVVADARADGAVAGEEDVRAVGAILYYALSGYWPHAEVPGPQSLPDALRTTTGELATPGQIRAGVPEHLDNLTMDLLDRRLAVPPAEVLTGELARLDGTPEMPYYAGYPEPDAGPVRLTAAEHAPTAPPSGRKIVLGVGALVVIAVLGLFVGLRVLTGGEQEPSTPPVGDPAPSTGAPSSSPDGATAAPLELSPSQVRVVDPPPGDRTELDGVEAVVDGDLGTGWRTATYYDGLSVVKPGIGILVDLGEPRQVSTVQVEVNAGGATAELRTGDTDPGGTEDGDDTINDSYSTVGSPIEEAGTTMVFDGFDPDVTYQYLLVWFTDLPPSDDGDQVEVQQVTVEGY